MRYWVAAALLCSGLVNGAWAAGEFTREEIAIMHNAGVKMALVGEKNGYVIPADITPDRLIQTEILDFSGKSLVVVPEWMSKFTQVRNLDLSNTGIKADSALLNALSNMPQLEILNLSGNPLFASGASNLGATLGKLSGLRYLNLSNTGGSISHYGALAGLNQLNRLDLSRNFLGGDLSGLGLKGLPLERLNLANSNLSGSVLPALPTATLGELDLSGNGSVKIEEEFGSMFALPKLAKFSVEPSVALPAGLRQKLERIAEAERKLKEAEEAARLKALEAAKAAKLKALEAENLKRYTINGDGTVTDTKTGLMWKRCSEGQSGDSCSGEATKYKWDDAMSKFGSDVSLAGHSGWRMPNHEELRSLVYCSNGTPQEEAWDHSCRGKDKKAGEYQEPTINQTAFPNTAHRYWSSKEEDASDAWVVSFYSGYDFWDDRNDAFAVRLVRSGQ